MKRTQQGTNVLILLKNVKVSLLSKAIRCHVTNYVISKCVRSYTEILKRTRIARDKDIWRGRISEKPIMLEMGKSSWYLGSRRLRSVQGYNHFLSLLINDYK